MTNGVTWGGRCLRALQSLVGVNSVRFCGFVGRRESAMVSGAPNYSFALRFSTSQLGANDREFSVISSKLQYQFVALDSLR